MMKSKSKKNKIILAILLVCLILIVILSTLIALQQELKIDRIAYNILVEKLRSPTLTTFMKIMTSFSNTLTIIILAIIITLVILLVGKNKKMAMLIPGNLVTITIINQILKFIFQRERPNGYRLIEMSGYSFPSGHAMVSMAFYGLLMYIVYRIIKNKPVKIVLITLDVIIIALIGISRIYLGVHYFSDVITGYSISIIYLYFVIKKLNQVNFFP